MRRKIAAEITFYLFSFVRWIVEVLPSLLSHSMYKGHVLGKAEHQQYLPTTQNGLALIQRLSKDKCCIDFLDYCL